MKRRLITRKWVRVTILSLSVLTMFAPSVTRAGSATGNFSSTANVSPSCTLTGGSISFGQIALGAGNTSVRGNITLLCTNTTTYDLVFSSGNSGNQLQRSMAGNVSGDSLKYNIYTDTTYATIIGDETNGTSHPMTGTSTGHPITNGLIAGKNAYVGIAQHSVSWYIYGQVSNNQYVTPDNYTDNLTVTINY